MTQIDKLRRRLLNARGEASFADVRRLLEYYGWTAARQSGSHVTFGKLGEDSISVPLVSGRRVKRGYVRRILKRLEIKE